MLLCEARWSTESYWVRWLTSPGKHPGKNLLQGFVGGGTDAPLFLLDSRRVESSWHGWEGLSTILGSFTWTGSFSLYANLSLLIMRPTILVSSANLMQFKLYFTLQSWISRVKSSGLRICPEEHRCSVWWCWRSYSLSSCWGGLVIPSRFSFLISCCAMKTNMKSMNRTLTFFFWQLEW